MRTLPVLATLGLGAAVPLHAQSPITQQYTTDAHPAQVDSTTQATNLRTREDGYDRMTVPVRVAGHGPFRFLIDTGADRTAISRDLALRLRLSNSEPATLHSVTGVTEVGTANVPLLDLSAKQVTNLQAALLESANMGADGILGLDSLRSQRILFDFKHQTLTIVPSSTRADISGDSIVVTGRVRNGRLILADASADSVRLTLVVDTGAQVSVGNPALYAKLNRARMLRQSGEVELQSVTGEKLVGRYTIVRELAVGGVTLKDLPIVFADSHAFRQLGLEGKPALLLGMNALRGFEKVSIDFARHKLRVVLPEEGAAERSAFASL
jgi:predicted aspartyl protease